MDGYSVTRTHNITIHAKPLWWLCDCGWGVGVQESEEMSNRRLIDHLIRVGQVQVTHEK